LRRNTKNDSNAIDEVAITYLSKLLSTSEKTVKSLTDNEDDCLLLIKQASKKRLNKRILKKLHPKISSLLMISREGGAASLTDKEMTFLSDALYRYFFRLKNEDVKACLKQEKEDNIKGQIKSYTICFIVTILHAACLKKYWKTHMNEVDLPKAMQFYEEYAREGFKNCEIDINLDNCREVLEIIKEKYL
jgi:hypothetical protein